ncbi:hypothetical protein ES708_14902 [subsurface metagenome]
MNQTPEIEHEVYEHVTFIFAYCPKCQVKAWHFYTDSGRSGCLHCKVVNVHQDIARRDLATHDLIPQN